MPAVVVTTMLGEADVTLGLNRDGELILFHPHLLAGFKEDAVLAAPTEAECKAQVSRPT